VQRDKEGPAVTPGPFFLRLRPKEFQPILVRSLPPRRTVHVLNRSIEPEGAPTPAAGEEDERALMARVGMGDARAFERIVARHMPMLHALAWRMLGDASEAEDVVQESLVKLWVNAKGWQPSGGGLGAWLRRIATNACLDRLRRPRARSDEGLPERADDAPLADSLIDAGRRRDAVQAAILSLPDRQRAAIVLTYHEGFPMRRRPRCWVSA